MPSAIYIEQLVLLTVFTTVCLLISRFPKPCLDAVKRSLPGTLARKTTGFVDEKQENCQDEKLKIDDNEAVEYEVTWPNDAGFDTVREESKPIDLAVTGHIPAYVAGTIYRNGPGANQVRNEDGDLKYQTSHWFDGFAQMHKFDLLVSDDGIDINTIRYTSRFGVDSLMEELAMKGRYDGYTFAQKRDPCLTMFRKVMCLFIPVPRSTPTNVNVPVTVSADGVGFPIKVAHKQRLKATNQPPLIARTDEGQLKALDPETLEPIGIAHQRDLHPLLRGPLSASHAQTDSDTGDVFNYNLELGPSTIYRVFRTSATTGETDVLATISARDIKPAYMHSFFLTENFVVLVVWSAHLMLGGVRVLWERNVMDAIAPFDASKTTKWFVIDRKESRGVVATFDSPASFCFHTINAYEQPSAQQDGQLDLICDLIEYENLDILHKFYYENLRSSSPAAAKWAKEKQDACGLHFARYRLASTTMSMSLPKRSRNELERKCKLPSPEQAQLLQTIPSPTAGDLPTINAKYACRPYRFFWNCIFDSRESTLVSGISKVDTLRPEQSIHWSVQGHSPGEALFIANPGGIEEDDGVLLTIVLDGFNGTSYLLCLDARTMQELGRADCQGPLSFAFHGTHVASGR